jgi:hypothetical protein
LLTLQMSRMTAFLNQSVRAAIFFGKNPSMIGVGLFIVFHGER